MNPLVLFAVAAVPPPGPVAVPFELLPTRHIVVSVRLNGKGPYRMLFDTGAPLNILGRQAAQDADLLSDDDPSATARVQVRSLRIGALHAAGVPMVVLDHPALAALSRRSGPVHGILGLPFFGRYRVTLDYQVAQLTFQANDHEPPDVLRGLLDLLAADRTSPGPVLAAAGLWGLVVAREAEDDTAGVTVQAVHAGGAAAAAGLRPGDRLLTLDGHWTDSVADCYRAAAGVLPGREVLLTIRRDGRELRLAVRPRHGI
jgi:hypothetical protein